MSDDGPTSRGWSMDVGMRLAESGDLLRMVAKECAEKLGPIRPGATRYVRVTVVEIDPAGESDEPGN